MTVVEALPHDLAVKAALEAIGKPVEFGEAPADALSGVINRTGPDYLTVFRVSAQRDGTLADPFSDYQPVYQVNATGRTYYGVTDLLGDVEPTLLGVTIIDRVVTRVEPVAERGAVPDRDVGPPHPFWGWTQIRLWTVPA